MSFVQPAFIAALPLRLVAQPTSLRKNSLKRYRSRRCCFRAAAVLPVRKLAHENHEAVIHVTTAQPPPSQPASPLIRFLTLPPELRTRATFAVIVGVLGAIAAVCQPVLYSRSLDAVLTSVNTIGAPSWSILRTRLGLQAAAYAVEAACTFAYIRLMTSVCDRLVARLRVDVFRTCLDNDVSFFDRKSDDVQRALTADVPATRGLLWSNLSADRGLRSILQIVLGVITCLFIDPLLGAIVFALLLPFASIVAGRLGLRRMQYEMSFADAENDVRFVANQTLDAIRTVKAYGGEPAELKTLRGNLDAALDKSEQVARARANSETMLRGAIYITLCAVMALGGWQVGIGNLAASRFLALTSYSWILLFSLIGIVYTFNDFQSLRAALTRTFTLLDSAKSAVKEKQTTSATLPATSYGFDIAFRNVSFAYPTRDTVGVVNNVSFEIPRNSTVALVGPSGAGKSTIAALLARFYKPQTGTIAWNGIDIHDVAPDEYINYISLVDQDPKLFQGTVRENIAYGSQKEMVSDADIESAARAANAHNFIMELPDRYDTVITKGSGLSGGQKQRVAIARAILRDAPCLILDEFSSALDSESEAAIQVALDKLLEGRSALVIAHRLSTIRNADIILFLKDGEIIERGTFDSLMARKDSAFRGLVEANSQMITVD